MKMNTYCKQKVNERKNKFMFEYKCQQMRSQTLYQNATGENQVENVKWSQLISRMPGDRIGIGYLQVLQPISY